MILRGISKHDGTIQHLAPEDQLPCLEGHRRLVKAQTETTFEWMYDDDDTLFSICSRPKICNQVRHTLLKAKSVPEPVVSGLDGWVSGNADGLCLSCTNVARLNHVAGRKELWEILPNLLDLPSWGELKKEREQLYVLTDIMLAAV